MTWIRALYRPAYRAPRAWLMATPPRTTEADAAIPVPGFDEDEATMAVAAARGLLDEMQLDSAAIKRLVVGSRTTRGLGPLVASVLDVDPTAVTEVLQGNDALASPVEEGVLVVQSDAPRPGRTIPQGPTPGAQALAQWGVGIPEARQIDVSPPPVPLTTEVMDRLARWERDAPLRVPMGAHIPQATWDRHAGQRYRLEGAACAQGHVVFPPRDTCPRCRALATKKALSRAGVLESFTVVAKGAAPSEFEPLQDIVGEYAVGVASFDGARVAAQTCDTPLDSLRIGAPVNPVFRRLYGVEGVWRYGVKLRQRAVPPQAR